MNPSAESDKATQNRDAIGGDQNEQDNEQSEGSTGVKNCDNVDEIVRETGLSFLAVLFNFCKGLVGAGFLALPLSFKSAQPLYAMILLLMVALLSYFSMSRLVRCAQYHYTRLNLTYLSFGNVAEQSLKVSFEWAQGYGKLAKNISNATTIVHQFGICSMYYLFISNTMENIFGKIEGEKAVWWFLLIFIPLVLFNTVLTMRILSVLCLIGNGLILLSLALVLYILFSNASSGKNDVAYNEISFAINIRGLFQAVGSIIISCLAQSLVLPLENKIKRPGQMLGPCGILSLGILISTVVYACVGFFGYLSFGKRMAGTLMGCLEKDSFLTKVIWAALCMSIFASFLLQMFVVVGVLWPRIQNWMKSLSYANKACGRVLFNALLVSVCFSLSFFVKDLATIISLIGVTTGTLLGFIYPALFDIFTFFPLFLNQGRVRDAYVRLVQDILLACFGLVVLSGGLSVKIIDLVMEGVSKGGCEGNVTKH